MNSGLLIARFTRRRSSLSLSHPVRLRCSREALRWQSGMRCPARLLHAKQTPGGFGNRPSATTSGREQLAGAEAFLLHPAPDRSPKSRGGAPRGERSRKRRPAQACLRGTRSASQALAGVRYSPAVGCRCTRAPFGAPLPPGRGGKRRGENANLGGLMPRENGDACLEEAACERPTTKVARAYRVIGHELAAVRRRARQHRAALPGDSCGSQRVIKRSPDCGDSLHCHRRPEESRSKRAGEPCRT